MSAPVVRVEGIRKTYGRTVAVDDVSFEVQQGEIFGLIGPNGAGKTTTMECVEGLRSPDRGAIAVLGLDPVRDVYRLQDRIGVQLQEAQLQKRIKVREAVDLWASLYRKPVDANRLLEQLGLDREAERLVHDAVRRTETAAVHRARAHQRSRSWSSSTSSPPASIRRRGGRSGIWCAASGSAARPSS